MSEPTTTITTNPVIAKAAESYRVPTISSVCKQYFDAPTEENLEAVKFVVKVITDRDGGVVNRFALFLKELSDAGDRLDSPDVLRTQFKMIERITYADREYAQAMQGK
ncbi:MAG: hypothetical protein JRC99_12450 [Deltaproteobacteria bacterium]|nr:hypothetical protein [Deltaproteobacteria bacterium]